MKRRGPGAARPLCGAALAAALLLPVAAAEQASAAPAADGKRQELPPMPSALDPRADAVECTAASREKAEKQDWSRQR
ncbi:serine protease, partial [Streptomyces althioticus]